MIEVERISRRLGTTLLIWSAGCIIIGSVIIFQNDPVLRGIGLQALLWGIIDAVIALLGIFRMQEQPISKITKILLVNVILDVVYQAIGSLLIFFFGNDAFVLGNGIGVIIQGAFLFFLDLYYYWLFKELDDKEIDGLE